MTDTLTAAKPAKQSKHIDQARRAFRASGSERLIGTQYAGELWLTDAYWAMPAKRCQARTLWDTVGASEGSYHVEGSPTGPALTFISDRGPRLGSVISEGWDNPDQVAADAVELESVRVFDVEGRPLIRFDAGPLEAVNVGLVAYILNKDVEASDMGKTWKVTRPAGATAGKPVTVWQSMTISYQVVKRPGAEIAWTAVGCLMPVKVTR